MGFTLNRSYRLSWDAPHQLAGLEVIMRSTSIGTLMKLRNSASSELPALLAVYVKSWNWEDDEGNVLPVSEESFAELEEPVLMEIGQEWHEAASGKTAPLDPSKPKSNSSNGRPSEDEVSIPMETL